MSWQWQYPRDPPPGLCDDGIFVECCTSIHGQTDCGLTTLGRLTPGSNFILAQRIPDDSTEVGSLDRLLEAAENFPSPIQLLEDTRQRLKESVEALKPELTIGDPQINVQLPESLGFAALFPVALLGLAVGGGIALLVKK